MEEEEVKCTQCHSTRIEVAEFASEGSRYYHCLNCGFFVGEPVKGFKDLEVEKNSIDLEVVGFYASRYNWQVLEGTLHVSLKSLGVDLRGIRVIRGKGKWFFYLPYASSKNIEGIDSVRYPTFSFTDNVKNEALRSLIQEKGKEYIESHCVRFT